MDTVAVTVSIQELESN